MKTIEEVIKNKSHLIGGKGRNYGFWERLFQKHIGKPIYLVDNLNDKKKYYRINSRNHTINLPLN